MTKSKVLYHDTYIRRPVVSSRIRTTYGLSLQAARSTVTRPAVYTIPTVLDQSTLSSQRHGVEEPRSSVWGSGAHGMRVFAGDYSKASGEDYE
jgi:capsule polysaccharide modification protein KpsS